MIYCFTKQTPPTKPRMRLIPFGRANLKIDIMSNDEQRTSNLINGDLLKQKQTKNQRIREFVTKWMYGHEEDTFIKNEYGNYIYKAGACSLDLKIFFELIIQDYAEENLNTKTK